MRAILILLILPVCTIATAQSETALLKTADSLATLNKHDAAILVFTKILKQKPTNEKALMGRGKTYGNLNKLDLAEKDFKEALAHNPDCVDCYLKLGMLKLMQNNLADANANVDHAIELDNKNVQAYLLKAQIAASGKKYSLASTQLNKAIDIDSNNANAFFARAKLFIEMGIPDMALKDLDVAIRLKPGMGEAYAEKGNIYAEQQKWDEALKYFLLGSQYDSLNSEYYKTIGSLYSSIKKDYTAALRYFTKALRLNDRDGETYAYRGDVNYSLEDMDASCSDYRAALARLTNPSNTEARNDIISKMAGLCDSSAAEYYYQRGIANYNLNRFEKAVDWYSKGFVKFPQHFMINSFKGNALLKLEKYDEAEAAYTKAITLKDNLSQEVETSNNYKDANEADRQHFIMHTIADAYRLRGEARLALNNYTGAMNDVDEGLKIMGAIPDGIEQFYYTKGSIYLTQQDNNGALTWFNKTLQAAPTFPEALVNRALVKLNLAYRTIVTQRSVSAKGATISLPSQTHFTVNTDNLESALSDCNKAIVADNKYGYAYYVRAMVKIALKQSDQCYDLLKAEQLGYSEAKPLIQENKCR